MHMFLDIKETRRLKYKSDYCYVKLPGNKFLEEVRHLMFDIWCLERPTLILSITGGAKDFKLDPKVCALIISIFSRVHATL